MQASEKNSTPIILVTGMAGAGRASALRVLEDIGYEALDNLPLALLPHLIHSISVVGQKRPLAIGLDFRTRGFTPQHLENIRSIIDQKQDLKCYLLFLECEDEVLRRRFTETRRRHPLAPDRPMSDGIKRERELLADIKMMADSILDTTEFTLAKLKSALTRRYALEEKSKLVISVISFAYRHGLPREADLVFDVRFLKNPFYNQALKAFTGLDEAVGRFIEEDEAMAGFFQQLTSLIEPLLPRYEQEGKSYLTIGMGCSGGKHRSVYVAKKLSQWLAETGWAVQLSHRDIEANDKRKNSE